MGPDVRPWRLAITCICYLIFFIPSEAFYVPGSWRSNLQQLESSLLTSTLGYSIKSYKDQENIPLLVNKVYSDRTQLQYAYFDLPFVCPPSGSKRHGRASGQSLSLNLGEVLRGDRIKNSDFEINMGQDVECEYLCDREVSRRDVQWAQELIEEGYVTEWILDNLPGATSFVTLDHKRKYYAAGFKLGKEDVDYDTGTSMYYIYNHFSIVVRWRKAPGRAGDRGGKVVIGFEVFPKSVGGNHRNTTGCPFDIASSHKELPLYIAANTSTSLAEKYRDSSYIPEEVADLDDGVTMTIPYTYSVYFREDNTVEWANRWNLYFSDQAESTSTHWLAILNSIIISSILGAVCMVIWIRTTSENRTKGDGVLEEAKIKSRKTSEKKSSGLLDQPGESSLDDELSDEETSEDLTGWKLLHGDIFRTPQYSGLLAPLIGSGMQLVFMVTGLLVLSCFGVLNPSWRGGFITMAVFLFMFAGGFSGYFSARIYRTFGGQNLRKNTLLTATLFPGLVFALLFFLNLFTWAQASSTAIPFTTLLALACLWLLIQLPLVHLGSHYGYHRSKSWEHPTKTNSIPRQIPTKASASWYSRNQLLLPLTAGLVPFAVLFIELLFVFKSLYLDKSSYYYVFGFLSIISTLLIITISEVVIITTYVQLCAENYHWWWTSFLTGGASGVWIFIYSIWYYWTKLHIDGFVSSLLFFSYTAIACTVYVLATGTVGFLSAYAFVRRIYSDVKVD